MRAGQKRPCLLSGSVPSSSPTFVEDTSDVYKTVTLASFVEADITVDLSPVP